MSLFFGLIDVGGLVFFWLLFVYCIFAFTTIEKDNDAFNGLTFVIFLIVLLTSLSDIKAATNTKEAMINAAIYIGGWIGIGLAYWLAMLNIDFYKIRMFCKTHNLSTQKDIENKYNDYSDGTRREVREEAYEVLQLYKNEPSFNTFVARVVAWPVSMIKVGLSRFAKNIFLALVARLKNYKARITGIKLSEN